MSQHEPLEDPSEFLNGQRIAPGGIRAGISAADLVDEAFLAYNGGRLGEAARLLVQKVLKPEVTLGVTLTGALTPAGLGRSCLIPLIQAGYIDWMISTGANLYHDTHFALDLALHRGNPFTSDTILRDAGVVRIYDILFDYTVLLDTDAFYRELIKAPQFQKAMSTAEFHTLVGKALHEREQALGIGTVSILSAAYQAGMPIYTSSPGDSSIGMNVAALALEGNQLMYDVNADVNETASIVLDAAFSPAARAVGSSAAARPRTSSSRRSPRSRRCSASTSGATTTSCRSPTPAPTPAASPAPPRARR